MMSCPVKLLWAICLCLGTLRCGRGMPEPAAPLTPPLRICTDGKRAACRSAVEIEAWLRDPDLRILGSAATQRGIQGAKVLTLSVVAGPGPVTFRAKWRAYSTLTNMSDPRRELAAYGVQRSYLEPDEYVVPPTAGYCFDLAEYRARVDPAARATFRGIPCVYGVLSYWLEDARSLDAAEEQGLLARDDRALDRQLFSRSPSYRDSAANANLLAYLIHHGDSHINQFVITGDAERPHLYIVDNSLAFDRYQNPDLPERWSELIVPALPLKSLLRLRLAAQNGFSQLAVVEQYRASNGRLIASDAGREAGRVDEGLRWVRGELQVGLTSAEIRSVDSRARALLRRLAERRVRAY
jgi:hypothetical protein